MQYFFEKKYQKTATDTSTAVFFPNMLCFSLHRLRFMKIFLLGSQSPADVSLRFIDIQNLPGLQGKCGINLGKAVGYVLMYGYDDLEWFLLGVRLYLFYQTL